MHALHYDEFNPRNSDFNSIEDDAAGYLHFPDRTDAANYIALRLYLPDREYAKNL
jgi:hypothetical protein